MPQRLITARELFTHPFFWLGVLMGANVGFVLALAMIVGLAP